MVNYITTMVSCLRLTKVRFSTTNLWSTKILPNPLVCKEITSFVCKRLAAQTLLWLLEFVIQISLEHDTIAVWNLAWSWSISTCHSNLLILSPSTYHCKIFIVQHQGQVHFKLFNYRLLKKKLKFRRST